MEGKYLQLKDLNSYVAAFKLSNYVWNIVINWDYLAKSTIGNQWVRSIDSISANIAEGFGRYSKKDKIKFYRYSFGSVYESKDWMQKAWLRKLITKEQYDYIMEELEKLPKEINHLIKYTNEKLAI